MNREKKLILNTFVLAIGNILPKLCNFVILPILTSVLTKLEYGTYDLILTSTYLIVPIISLLLPQAVFRYLLSEKSEEEKKKVISSSFVYILFSLILILIAGSVLLHKYDYHLRYTILLYIMLSIIYEYVQQVARGLEKLTVYSITSLLVSTLNMVFIIISVSLFHLALLGIMYSLNLSLLFIIAFSVYRLKLFKLISYNTYEFSTLKHLLNYSIPLLPNIISWWIISVSDRWIITAFLGTEMNAIYAVANKIPSMYNLVYNTFNLAWQESATVSINDNSRTEYYSKVFEALHNFLVGGMLILISVSPFLFKILVNGSYAEAYRQMPILLLGMIFQSFSSFYGGIYIALKKTKSVGISSAVAAIINVIINVLLIKIIGIYAASVSTAIAYIVIALYRAFDIQKLTPIQYNFKRILKTILIILTICIINYINNFYLNILIFIFSIFISIVLNKKMVGIIFTKTLVKLKLN